MVANENRCPGFGLTTRWNGPGMLQLRQEEIEIPVSGKVWEGPNPGRSLVPAAQAQAARGR